MVYFCGSLSPGTGTAQNMTDLGPKQQLADFLKTRRDRLQPEQVGLKAGGRRRIPGLRRDEVAQLAGLSVAWYTWLEQGRDIRLSRPSARRLALALQLDEAETAHLVALADTDHRDAPELKAGIISPTLKKIIDMQGENPAYVMNERWDVLVWNAASELLFGAFGRDRFGESNALRYMFLDPLAKASIVDWERHARRMTAQFRLTGDHLATNPGFAELISHLRTGSSEFERFWTSHDILPRTAGRKEFRHLTLGELAFDHAAFQVNEDRSLKMVIYVTSDPTSKAKVTRALGSIEAE